jgi:hypothetical protein
MGGHPLLSTDGKDILVVPRKSREMGELFALTKNGRNALVWVRDDWTQSIIDGLTTIQQGESAKVGNTDDGRLITLISTTKKVGRGGDQVSEHIAFILSGEDNAVTGGRNVLSLPRENVRALIGALSAATIPAAKLVQERAGRPAEPTQADVLADDRYAADPDPETLPGPDVTYTVEAVREVWASMYQAAACPTCGRFDDL